ncbi:MAG: 2-keto-4-pentenoate hydratase [Rubrivivax sp.]|nr:MAG: 2-keto-4-pentenoate hydratase [Rubrivivax sp.]
MTLSPRHIDEAAEVLASRRVSGQQGPRLPDACRPTDLASALAIQAAVLARLGDAVGAWKCGSPAPGRVVVAPILASTVHHAGLEGSGTDCPVWARKGHARVEPELAFVLGRDLPPREAPYTADDVLAAVASAHLALELIDSRYADRGGVSFEENLADGLVNQGLLLGPAVELAKARHAAMLRITIRQGIDGELLSKHDGRHPDGAPCDPLVWLANHLRTAGDGLRAGQAVITGSYAGSFELPLDQVLAIDYAEAQALGGHELGRMVCRFAPKRA